MKYLGEWLFRIIICCGIWIPAVIFRCIQTIIELAEDMGEWIVEPLEKGRRHDK